jgi:hypothetical protein
MLRDSVVCSFDRLWLHFRWYSAMCKSINFSLSHALAWLI